MSLTERQLKQLAQRAEERVRKLIYQEFRGRCLIGGDKVKITYTVNVIHRPYISEGEDLYFFPEGYIPEDL